MIFYQTCIIPCGFAFSGPLILTTFGPKHIKGALCYLHVSFYSQSSTLLYTDVFSFRKFPDAQKRQSNISLFKISKMFVLYLNTITEPRTDHTGILLFTKWASTKTDIKEL